MFVTKEYMYFSELEYEMIEVVVVVVLVAVVVIVVAVVVAQVEAHELVFFI